MKHLILIALFVSIQAFGQTQTISKRPNVIERLTIDTLNFGVSAPVGVFENIGPGSTARTVPAYTGRITDFLRADSSWQTVSGTATDTTSLSNRINADTTDGAKRAYTSTNYAPKVHAHAASDITGTAVLTNDSRLSDARTPTAHTHVATDITGTSAATPATSGTMTVNMTTDIITITPTGSCTFNASGGATGRIITFHITTSGTSSYTLTFGTNFRKTGTLATGTTSARYFSITFRCINGTIWSEIARTAAQT